MNIHDLPNSYIAIEIPARISAEGYGYNKLYTGDGEFEFHSLPYNEMPPVKSGIKTAQYEYVFSTQSYSEAQASEIVERRDLIGEGNFAYVNYNLEHNRIAYYATAIESLDSLFESMGIDNAIVLKPRP